MFQEQYRTTPQPAPFASTAVAKKMTRYSHGVQLGMCCLLFAQAINLGSKGVPLMI